MKELDFFYGAMNCGKTTRLLQVANNHEENGMKVIIIKPKVDSKGGKEISSRLGVSREVDFLISEEDNIIDCLHENVKIDSIDCLLVDEVQFFKSKQIDQLFRLAVIHNIHVVCYGLRTDFLMKGFEGSSRLLEIAHNIEEITTKCSCGENAVINARLENNEYVFAGEQIIIDDSIEVKYKSLCGECYLKEKSKKWSKSMVSGHTCFTTFHGRQLKAN